MMKSLKGAVVIAVNTAVVLLGTALPSGATDADLKTIMRELSSTATAIVEAIAYEDYAAIETHALRVANHEKPAVEERMKIIKSLGARGADFIEADERTHHAALMLAEAAKRKEMEAVLDTYTEMLSGCVECHSNFRTEVRKLFSEKEI